MRGSIRDQLGTQTAEDALYRLEGEKLVKAHTQSITDLDAKIKQLQDRRDQRQVLLNKAELQSGGIRPCQLCNRLVPSPCNDVASMNSSGVWDSWCQDYRRRG